MVTIVALVATLGVTAGLLVIHASGATGDPRLTSAALAVLTGLFAVRVAGQLVVIAAHPRWLPPMEQWNLLRYRILLPIQLVLIALMTVVTVDLARAADALPPQGPGFGRALVAGACVYAASMVVRYAVRMWRRSDQRWFGGAIPIVFHCVLATWLFILGAFHAAG